MHELTIIRKIFSLIPEMKEGLGKGLLIGISYEVIKFIPLILIKLIVDALVVEQTKIFTLFYFIGGILAAYLVMNLIDYFAKKAEYLWIVQYETNLLKKAKKKLLELHLGFHEMHNTGAQVSRITKGTHRLIELVWFTFEEFIPTSIQLVLTFLLLLYEQWLLAFIFVLFIPLMLFITVRASKRIQRFRRLYHRKYDEAIGELGESLLNISTVKDYVQEKQQFHKFNVHLREYIANAQKRWTYALSWLIWRDLLITIGRVLTLGVAVYLVFRGTLTAGSLVLVYTLTERAFLASMRIGKLYSYLEDALESINRLTDLLQEKPQVKDLPHAQPVKKLQGEIEYQNVTFAYGRNPPVLHDFQLQVKPRQVVALVGRSGSGKTTVAKLLLRNYEVVNGALLVDGKDIRHYRLSDYKRRIAVVSQNVEIFNRSVLENILFANPRATKGQVISAAKKAHAHEFIVGFPHGYDTLVGEKGVRLSGGQKQRISIARALLKNPDIYIFDEATSSLDTESERFIQKSIFSIAGKKTTLIIAHRLSTIKKADRIVVMEEGKILEQGTYAELLRRKGTFWKMVALQQVAELRE